MNDTIVSNSPSPVHAMRGRLLRSVAAVLPCLTLLSCGTAKGPEAANSAASVEGTAPKSQPATKRDVTVSIAASTKEAIETLAADFSKANDIAIHANPGPSSGLATQILEGAPADLFLSANRRWAEKVSEAGLAEAMRPLLTNKLAIVVPKGNPAGIKEPKDLASDKVKKIALAGEKVPAGMYADQALTKLGLLEGLIGAGKIARGQDVRSALSYVERGEAEAGIVYSTDLGAADSVEQVYEFDPALHDEIVYVLVLLKQGADNPAAKRFFDFLQSYEAHEVYAKAGFERIQDK